MFEACSEEATAGQLLAQALAGLTGACHTWRGSVGQVWCRAALQTCHVYIRQACATAQGAHKCGRDEAVCKAQRTSRSCSANAGVHAIPGIHVTCVCAAAGLRSLTASRVSYTELPDAVHIPSTAFKPLQQLTSLDLSGTRLAVQCWHDLQPLALCVCSQLACPFTRRSVILSFVSGLQLSWPILQPRACCKTRSIPHQLGSLPAACLMPFCA